MNLPVATVAEENFSLRIDRRSFGEFVSLTNKLPFFAGNQDSVEGVVSSLVRRHRLRPIFPKPAHLVGKNTGALLAAVIAVTPGVIHFVAGEGQRALHGLIRHPPIASAFVVIVRTILQKNAKWLRLEFADQSRIAISAAQTDVSSNRAPHATKSIR